MLISDIDMPVLNGIDMLTLLQADPVLEKMEVLIVSHVASEEKIRKIISLGVSDYVLKPLQHDSVIKRLQRAAARILERRKRSGEKIERSRSQILVAHPDPNYRAFAESTLEADFSVQTARSVADVLVKSLRFKPDAILISPELPGLKLEFLIDKLKSIPDFKTPKFFGVGETADWRGDSDRIDGSLPRSFVPETLRSNLVRLLSGGPPLQYGPLAWAGSLEPELRTALHQALGMMTGIEPAMLETLPEDVDFELYGGIFVTAADEDFQLSIEVHCRRPFAKALTSAMLGSEDEKVDEEIQYDALQEILNVLAGRVKNSCLERRIDVSIGLPKIFPQPPRPLGKPLLHVDKYYCWQEEHYFLLAFRVNTHTGPSKESNDDENAS